MQVRNFAAPVAQWFASNVGETQVCKAVGYTLRCVRQVGCESSTHFADVVQIELRHLWKQHRLACRWGQNKKFMTQVLARRQQLYCRPNLLHHWGWARQSLADEMHGDGATATGEVKLFCRMAGNLSLTFFHNPFCLRNAVDWKLPSLFVDEDFSYLKTSVKMGILWKRLWGFHKPCEEKFMQNNKKRPLFNRDWMLQWWFWSLLCNDQ